jgi:hypothetical protein
MITSAACFVFITVCRLLRMLCLKLMLIKGLMVMLVLLMACMRW